MTGAREMQERCAAHLEHEADSCRQKAADVRELFPDDPMIATHIWTAAEFEKVANYLRALPCPAVAPASAAAEVNALTARMGYAIDQEMSREVYQIMCDARDLLRRLLPPPTCPAPAATDDKKPHRLDRRGDR